MRPIGSTNGRIPRGGYPAVTPALGGFLAGFIEGEGCFLITRQTRGYGYRCGMSLTARDDDEALINQLAKTTRLGTVRRTADRPTSRPQVTWRVMAKSDCRRLMELLHAYPLRGRKGGDFAIWAAAVNWWIGSDATERRPSREWGPMPYLKERLGAAKRYDASLYTCIDSGPPGLSSDWSDFLAGFITAEGHLGMNRTTAGSFAPRLTVRLRADDEPLLGELRNRLDGGKIRGPYSGRHPVLNWTIASRDDLLRTVAVLDEHPLKGRKQVEYRLWREAVGIYASDRARREQRGRLLTLERELKRARAYSTRVDYP